MISYTNFYKSVNTRLKFELDTSIFLIKIIGFTTIYIKKLWFSLEKKINL